MLEICRTCLKNIIFFSENNISHIAYLLGHVTYVTSFNKNSDPDVKLAEL